MAGSVNKVILLGNLGKDPEIRTTQAGLKIVNLRIATSDSWTDKTSGERQERTEWHQVVIMNENLASVAERFLHKGSKVYVEGKLQTRKWTDQSGQDRYSTEIMLGRFGAELVLLDSRGGEGAGEGAVAARERAAPRSSAPPRAAGEAAGEAAGGPSWDAPKGGGDLDDEIPF